MAGVVDDKLASRVEITGGRAVDAERPGLVDGSVGVKLHGVVDAGGRERVGAIGRAAAGRDTGLNEAGEIADIDVRLPRRVTHRIADGESLER
jgi:hypothetical protein